LDKMTPAQRLAMHEKAKALARAMELGAKTGRPAPGITRNKWSDPPVPPGYTKPISPGQQRVNRIQGSNSNVKAMFGGTTDMRGKIKSTGRPAPAKSLAAKIQKSGTSKVSNRPQTKDQSAVDDMFFGGSSMPDYRTGKY